MTAIDWGRVRVREFNPPPRGKGKKPFKVEWVKLPDHWIVQLERSRHLGTYKLALRILRAAFQQQYMGGDIVLSAAFTRLPRTTRWSAIKEMVGLKLIRIERNGNQAAHVVELLGIEPRRRRGP
jgi:hypothetical protein